MILTWIRQQKSKWISTASAKKCFWLCRHSQHLQQKESGLLRFTGRIWCVSAGRCELQPELSPVANGLPSQSAGSLSEPSENQCNLWGISVWEFLTIRPRHSLSHLFLPLWHRNNSFQSLKASLASLYPIHHVLSQMDGPLPCLFPWLPVCCFYHL